MTPLEKWETRYRAGEMGGRKPSPAVIQAAGELAPGRALDLACGTGRNALHLAKNGWSVVAIDGSEAGIGIVKRRASRLGVDVDALVLDLERGERLPFDNASYDLVCILLYLHRPLFAEAKRVVRAGGLVVAAIHTIDDDDPPGMNPDFLLQPGELPAHFAGWEIIFSREGPVREDTHKRRIAEIIARRPS